MGTSGNDIIDATYINIDGDKILDGTNFSTVVHGLEGNDSIGLLAGDDVAFLGEGNDTLYGGDGNDTLYGQGGADHFIFDDRQDKVMDFQDDVDTIELNVPGLANVAEALTHATQVGGDIVFDFGSGDTLTIVGADISVIGDDLLLT